MLLYFHVAKSVLFGLFSDNKLLLLLKKDECSLNLILLVVGRPYSFLWSINNARSICFVFQETVYAGFNSSEIGPFRAVFSIYF